MCQKRMSSRRMERCRNGGESSHVVGLEFLRKKQDAEMEVGEMKMLRIFLVTRMERIRNESMRGGKYLEAD